MINSFQIKNFRQIKSLEFEALGRINLITGKNNTGKTSVLEALHIYAGRGYIGHIANLLSNRDEDVLRKGIATVYSVSLDSILGFFPEYKLEFSDNHIIRLKTNNNSLELQFMRFYSENILNSNGSYLNQTVHQDEDSFDDKRHIEGISFVIKFNEQKKYVEVRNYNEISISTRLYQDSLMTSNFVMLNGGTPLANYWDIVTLTPRESKVVEVLKIIEPNIERLNFVNDRGKRKGVVMLEDGTRHPLGRMGDGINRILAIILALVNAENGFLLIDEFENGLHFSIQEKLWEVIFKTAEQLNVQVFATTHSNDCVSAFAKVQQDLEYSDTKLFRMFLNKNGDVAHREFTSEDLSIALEQNIEIRN